MRLVTLKLFIKPTRSIRMWFKKKNDSLRNVANVRSIISKRLMQMDIMQTDCVSVCLTWDVNNVSYNVNDRVMMDHGLENVRKIPALSTVTSHGGSLSRQEPGLPKIHLCVVAWSGWHNRLGYSLLDRISVSECHNNKHSPNSPKKNKIIPLEVG